MQSPRQSNSNQYVCRTTWQRGKCTTTTTMASFIWLQLFFRTTSFSLQTSRRPLLEGRKSDIVGRYGWIWSGRRRLWDVRNLSLLSSRRAPPAAPTKRESARLPFLPSSARIPRRRLWHKRNERGREAVGGDRSTHSPRERGENTLAAPAPSACKGVDGCGVSP